MRMGKRASLLIIIVLVVLLAGCTLEEPGYMVATSDSKVQVVDSDGDIIGIDSTTTSIKTIDYAHAEIHCGDHYYVQGFIELDIAQVHRVKVVTPDSDKWSHLIFVISSSGITSTTLDEGATGGMGGGAGVIPINNNRNIPNTSGMVFISGVAAAVGYDLRIENDKWGALGFKSTSGGGSARSDELIFKSNTTYLRTFTSFTDDNIIQFRASWYEHTNR